jgi:MFS transporter, Spinster family, sphingosine-1-phosphate transporter
MHRTDQHHSSRPAAYAWVVVGLLWVVSLLNYLDRLMITTMRDPIQAQIHGIEQSRMSDAQFGLLTSVFLWTYAAASPLGGFLADRVGRRGIIIASLFFWSAATFFTGQANTLNQMLLARVLMGLSEACYIPAALALIADYHRGPTRSLATGLNMSGIYAGAAMGGLGGYLAEQFGWRFGFRLFGAIGIAYCFVLLLGLRDAAPTEDEQPGPSDRSAVPKGDLLSVLSTLLTNPGFVTLMALNILVGVVNWSVYGWMPTFLKTQFSLGLGAAGLSATAYIQVASFVGVLVAGTLADRWSRTNLRARAITPAFGYILAGPFLILAASTNLLPLAIVAISVFGLGRGAFDSNQMPLLRQLIPERFSATGYGLLNLIGTTAGGVMVYVGGALMDAHVSLAHVFQTAGAGLIAAGVLLLVIPFPGRHPREVQVPSRRAIAAAS